MIKNVQRYLASGLVAFGLGLSTQASASPILTGDTVNIHFTDFSNFDTSTDAVVGPGDEADFYFGNYTVDVGDNYATITVHNGPFCGMSCTGNPGYLIVSGIDFTPSAAITGVSLTDGGLGAFNPTFTANSVTFELTDQSESEGQYATVNFTTGDATAVPEPASLALLGTGLLGYAARRRQKRAK